MRSIPFLCCGQTMLFGVSDEVYEQLRADPVGIVLATPGVLAVRVAVGLMVRELDLSHEAATQRLLAESIERTAHLDVYEQEKRIAEIQRAVDQAVEMGRPPAPRCP